MIGLSNVCCCTMSSHWTVQCTEWYLYTVHLDCTRLQRAVREIVLVHSYLLWLLPVYFSQFRFSDWISTIVHPMLHISVIHRGTYNVSLVVMLLGGRHEPISWMIWRCSQYSIKNASACSLPCWVFHPLVMAWNIGLCIVDAFPYRLVRRFWLRIVASHSQLLGNTRASHGLGLLHLLQNVVTLSSVPISTHEKRSLSTQQLE